MDIWNVAFPEGAVIDPNTAWKVFWKTAASMDGDSGFSGEWRKDYLDFVSYGGYWTDSTNNDQALAHTIDSFSIREQSEYLYIPTIDHSTYPVYDGSQSRFIRDYLYWFTNECAKRNTGNNARYCELSLFVPDDYQCTSPCLVLQDQHGCPYDQVQFFRYLITKQRGVGVRTAYDMSNMLSQIVGQRQIHLYQKRWSGALSDQYASVVSYLPALIPSDSDFLNVHWPMWWVRICEGDSVAHGLSCLLWCDWILSTLREMFDLDSTNNNSIGLRFNFAKTTLINRNDLAESVEKSLRAIHYRLSDSPPARPLDY